MSSERYARFWSTVLIALGVGLLAAVFVLAFTIVRDPGMSFDRWTPVEEGEVPQAAFSWASTGLGVEFTDTSTAGDAELTDRAWDFGDASTGDEPNPTHRYVEDGEFPVTLQVTDADGLTSRAEAVVDVEAGTENAGQGQPGLTELADSVISTVERVAKGAGVVLLVIGLFVVMVMAGGRLLKHGVAALRPIPGRISLKVRPREMERDLSLDVADRNDAMLGSAPLPDEDQSSGLETVGGQDERARLGV